MSEQPYRISQDWRLRANAIATIESALFHPTSPSRLAETTSTPPLDLLQSADHQPMATFLRMLLSAEKHSVVVAAKQRILIALVGRLPIEHLEHQATAQLLVAGLCRQGGAGSNRVSKALMQRLLPTAVVHRLLSAEFLHGRSARFIENALRMVLFAFMTFPSTYFDMRACVVCAVRCAVDRTRRVRRAALDVLAVLGQIGTVQLVLDVVHEQLTDHQRHGQNGQGLGAAIKARLSRRQLPLVSADGSVQYALRMSALMTSDRCMTDAQPNMTKDEDGERHLFGADVEWILAGAGVVSPTSLRRERRVQSENVVKRYFFAYMQFIRRNSFSKIFFLYYI